VRRGGPRGNSDATPRLMYNPAQLIAAPRSHPLSANAPPPDKSRSILQEFWTRMTTPGPPRAAEDERVIPSDAQAPTPRSLASRAIPETDEFVIIGLGRFGTSVARTLVSYGYTVLAIDRSSDRVQALSTVLPHVVQLDSTNLEALRQVGADSFEVGVVCIGEDFESNLLTTVLLLKLGVKRVITKARTNTQKEILERVGAHEVILPEHEAGVRLARRMAAGHFIDYLEVSRDVGIVELVAPPFTWGKSLVQADIRNRFGLSVIAIQRDTELIVSPMPDFVIERNDVLVVLGKLGDAESFSS
jgi:trk system potassium uptake protein